MEQHGRIHITSRVDTKLGKLRGQDLELCLVDRDGIRHMLPAKSVVIRCDGRKEEVLAEVVLMVSKIDLDLAAVFINEKAYIE